MTVLLSPPDVGYLTVPPETAAAGFCEVEPAVPLADGLFERFRRAVEARAGRRYRGLRVEVVDGVGVILHGRTDCYYAKQLAQHVIGRLTGRPVLGNRIEVFAASAAGGEDGR